MKPTPKGRPRISHSLYYQDPAKAIDWLCTAFGFEVRLKVEGEGGRIEHSELLFGEGVVMVAGEERGQEKGRPSKSPKSIAGATTQSLMIYVEDAAAHCERARKAGGKITYEPKVTDYGPDHWADKSYECEDLEGHR